MKKQNTRNHGLALRAAVTALFALWIAGCNDATIGSVCDKWDQKTCDGWDGKSACESAGQAALQTARDTNCEAPFQDYLRCVQDATNCSWDVACKTEKDALEKCQGSIF